MFYSETTVEILREKEREKETCTLMSIASSSTRPRSVVIERTTSFTVHSLGVVTTVTCQRGSSVTSNYTGRVAASPGGVHVDLEAASSTSCCPWHRATGVLTDDTP